MNPSGAFHWPLSMRQSSGMKSHAVFSDAAGMPGVSGEEKERGPPMSEGFAKLPGFVPCCRLEGLLCTTGWGGRIFAMAALLAGCGDPYAGCVKGASTGGRTKKTWIARGAKLRPAAGHCWQLHGLRVSRGRYPITGISGAPRWFVIRWGKLKYFRARGARATMLVARWDLRQLISGGRAFALREGPIFGRARPYAEQREQYGDP